MKGLLHKTEQGWFVGPTDDMAGVIYPLHPKDEEMMDSIFTAKFTKDVNFEIIYVDVVGKEYLSNKVPYAKLVNMTPDKSDEIEGLIRALGKVANILGVSSSGYRYLGNNGKDGGQEVPHLHFHIFGGEKLGRMIHK